MGATSVISERLKSTDKVLSQTLKETRQLIVEAKSIHDQTTSEIQTLVGRKVLSEKEKRKYAELVSARGEAEKAYYMLKDMLNQHGE